MTKIINFLRNALSGSPPGQPNVRGVFAPLSEASIARVLDAGNSDAYDRSGGVFSNRAACDILPNNYSPNSGVVAGLYKALKEEGIEQIKYLGAGDNAVVAEILPGANRVVRFRGLENEQPNTQNTPQAPQILRPFFQLEVEGRRVEGHPKVLALDKAIDEGIVTVEQANALIFHLRKALVENNPPCYCHDFQKLKCVKYEQVGLLGDFTPVIIDTGAAVILSDWLQYLENVVRTEPKKAERARQMIQETLDDVNNLKSSDFPSIPDNPDNPGNITWNRRWLTESDVEKVQILADACAMSGGRRR